MMNRVLSVSLLVAIALLGPAVGARAQFPRGNVSIDLRNAEVRDVIWAFAKEHRLSVIIGEEVTGNVTLSLRNVPIRTAFDSILGNGSLGYTRDGQILRVNSLERMAQRRAVEPLVTRIVTVNYFTTQFGETGSTGAGGRRGDSGDDLEQLRESLSEHLSDNAGASISIVPRTNSLVITDVGSNVDRLVQMVKQLDAPTPQVLIEAKIVEMDATYSRSLGINTGVQAAKTTNARIGGGGVANLPATGFQKDGDLIGGDNLVSPGSSAFNLFLDSVGGSDMVNLDIVISAAEQNGLARMLATPRVMTLNNREAIITTGQRIPFTTLGSTQEQGGTNLIATVEFIDAALELAVTPHVTADGSILMKVRASRNTADFSNTVFQNPTINTREARNEVLVRDGDTIVIAGIYTDDGGNTKTGTPFLQDIPVLGHLFKSKSRNRSTQELIFLITPQIVHDPAMVRATSARDNRLGTSSLALGEEQR